MKDELEGIVRKLATIRASNVKETRKWLMQCANRLHVRPIAFARERLHELQKTNAWTVVNRARRRSARFAETVPFEGALAYTRVMKRIAKTGCTLAEADAYVREKYGER